MNVCLNRVEASFQMILDACECAVPTLYQLVKTSFLLNIVFFAFSYLRIGFKSRFQGRKGGGQPDRGRQAQIARGTPSGRPEGEGSADKRWRTTGGTAVQVDGRSTTGRERGGKKRVKIERKAASTGERWGTIGDRSGGREKRNE